MLAARGILTIPALFAASLEPGIRAVYLAGGLVSFQSVIETEEYLGGNYHNPATAVPAGFFSSFVPDLLRHTDLPEVAASTAPRRVILAGVIDAAGKKMDPGAVTRIYESARNAQVLPEAAWTASALASTANNL